MAHGNLHACNPGAGDRGPDRLANVERPRTRELAAVHTRPLCCDFDVKGIGEPTLDELLAEPAVRLLMRRDGVDEAALRQLAAEVRKRRVPRQSKAMPAMKPKT